MKLRIQRNELRASILTAAKEDDSRWFLRGVLVQRNLSGLAVAFISTNGHVLSVINSSMPNHEVAEEVGKFDEFTIQRNQIKTALASGDDEYIIECAKESGPDHRLITMTGKDSGIAVSMLELGGDFPDWRRLIPQSVSGDAGWFSSHYLHLIERFSKRLERGFVFHHNGARTAAVVDYNGKALMAVMPVEQKMNKDYSLPLWTNIRPEQPAQGVTESGQ